MELSAQDIGGLAELESSMTVYSEAFRGNSTAIPYGLSYLGDHDKFWSSWDRFKSDAENELSSHNYLSEDFLGHEVGYLRDRHSMTELDVAGIYLTIAPAVAGVAGRSPVKLPAASEARNEVQGLASEIGKARPELGAGRFVRLLGRGLLILAGAGVVGTNAAVCIASGGIAIPAVTSMALGVGAIAAGTFNDPNAATRFQAFAPRSD